MTLVTDEIAIAQHMIAHYGERAAALMDRRARDNEAAGEQEAALFWAQVARVVRALQRSNGLGQRPEDPPEDRVDMPEMRRLVE